ncbi:MAG: PhnD/SsuA/transferrin family substrate-binding protein [Methylovulum sp.]|nr:PhnD/SsuA/transferrin family substrate-binding protein [Methylovulum sp.]
MPNFRSLVLPLSLCALLIAPPAISADTTTLPANLSTWFKQQWQRLKSSLPEPTEAYQPTFSAKSQHSKGHIVGIHPLHNPKRLFEVYGPIVDFINTQIPQAQFKLEASRNYEEFNKKLYSGHFDFAMPNPYQTIQSLQHGYRVFGKMADDGDFRGIILVRKDSGIEKITDLKGKAVAYPAKTAVAATMMPQHYLHTHGININTDIENRYVGSQESSIMNVLLGHVAAAATWPIPWRTFSAANPELAAQLEVKWQTEALVNNGWVVRDDIPPALALQFAHVLFNLQNTSDGQKLLATVPVSRFEAANNDTYKPVQRFLDDFNQHVRPIEE